MKKIIQLFLVMNLAVLGPVSFHRETAIPVNTNEMAKAMKIPVDKFYWYAAFHDEGGHPHVHMVCYSEDPKMGFLSKGGIAQIKSGLARKIFEQDLHEIYERQTQRRDALNNDAEDVLKQLVQQMQSGTLENEYIAQLMLDLARRLKNTSGKSSTDISNHR